jgi:deoxycytidine triphosphate deaminase
MSVVPFIVDSGNSAPKTITTDKREYEQGGGVDGELIFIQNFDKNQVTATDACNASYDLRVGDEYQDHRDLHAMKLPDNSSICLQPGSAIIIQTLEYVQFPASRFGHIVPKVSLLQMGLSNTSSKIDPGYGGKLLITVFNLGKKPITLKKEQKFCTLYVLDVKPGVITYAKEPKGLPGTSRKNKLDKFRDFIEINQTFLTGLLLVMTLLLTFVQIIDVLPKLNLGFQNQEKSK